ncbi:MAG: hypothetical protein Q4G67_02710 [Actinomycetia bacterium]|nr:hypothetical protein [Actinomycetes bacterium]
MNDTKARKTGKDPRGGFFGDPGLVAPHLEKDWRDSFIIEARLKGVPGNVIGDALVTADSHVVESGESAHQAFGDPKVYARETAAATPTKGLGMGIPPLSIVAVLAGLFGMFAFVSAVEAWYAGTAVTITAGTLAGLGVLLALVAASVMWSEQVLRVAVERRALFALGVPVVLIALFVGIFLVLRQELFEVSASAYGVGGACLLILGSVLMFFSVTDDDDGITAPGEPVAPSTRTRLTAALVMPVMTVLVLLFTVGLAALIGA